MYNDIPTGLRNIAGFETRLLPQDAEYLKGAANAFEHLQGQISSFKNMVCEAAKTFDRTELLEVLKKYEAPDSLNPLGGGE